MPDHCTDNELALLQRVAAGDAEAFEALYRHYSATVYTTVITYVRNAPEAEEIVQQLFVKLWMRRAALGRVENFRDYLFATVRNSVFNYFNQLSRQTRLINRIRTQTPEHTAEEADHRCRQNQYDQLLEKAVRQLPDRQKQVYLLASGEALGYDDIAQRMQISRLTAKKHMELARKAVREYISRYLAAFVLLFLFH